MNQILSDFGIQPILLLAQIVNFFILLFLLRKFLYGPILKVLKERKDRIAEGLKNAEEIELKLQKTTQEQEKVLAKAALDASEIVENATKSAEEIINQAHLKAEHDIEILMENGRKSLESEREKLLTEVRSEVANLIALSLERITGKTLTKKDQENLIKRSINEIR